MAGSLADHATGSHVGFGGGHGHRQRRTCSVRPRGTRPGAWCPAARWPVTSATFPERADIDTSARMCSDGVADLCALVGVRGAGAMGAAVEPARHLDTVTEDAAAAVFAYRRQLRDGALEAVERVRLTAGRADLKGHPVVVTTNVAGRHGPHLPLRLPVPLTLRAARPAGNSSGLDQALGRNMPEQHLAQLPVRAIQCNALP